jgi:nickel-dependent lactate racemase
MRYTEIDFPYGEKVIKIKVPQQNLQQIIRIPDMSKSISENITIKTALQNPIASKCLSNIVKSNDRIVIVISDITRPVPNYKILPHIFTELKKSSIEYDKITIVVGTGLHRENSKRELEFLVGKEIIKSQSG